MSKKKNRLLRLFGNKKKLTGDTIIRTKSALESESEEDACPDQPIATQSAAEAAGIKPLEQEVLLEDFEILDHLGRGGMGTVHLVRSCATGNQFAVKRISENSFQGRQHQRQFMKELLTWIDLPLHPNIAACRFFRTTEEGRIVIFAEYVEGGSLDKWIKGDDERPSKLYEGGQHQALKRILDVAIQVAWGLHALHEQGLVHQDVKPANILMTPEGVPKITDFGLTRARSMAYNSGDQREAGIKLNDVSNPLVSIVGMSPAYCSPEQADYQRLSAKTDIWSWGVSVLEMFTGEVTWMTGVIAQQALELFLANSNRIQTSGRYTPVRIPDPVVEILRKCFQPDPENRLENLHVAAERLQKVFEREFGQQYERQRPTPIVVSPAEGLLRSTKLLEDWSDPHFWVEKANKAAGLDREQSEPLTQDWQGSRKARIIADLIGYQEAFYHYKKLIDTDRNDLMEEWAQLLLEKAVVHKCLDDFSSALRLNSLAIEVYESLRLPVEVKRLMKLTLGYRRKGNILCLLGEDKKVVEILDHAIDLLSECPDDQQNWEIEEALADCYCEQAESIGALGHDYNSQKDIISVASRLCDKVISIREKLNEDEGGRRLQIALADGYRLKALYSDSADAIEYYKLALNIYNSLAEDESDMWVIWREGNCYLNLADIFSRVGQHTNAMSLWEKAKTLFEYLVHEKSNWDLTPTLALLYTNGGAYLYKNEDDEESLRYYNMGINLYEQLVNLEGRLDLRGNLALNIANRALLYYYSGSTSKAVDEATRAVSVISQEIERTGREDVKRSQVFIQQVLQQVKNE